MYRAHVVGTVGHCMNCLFNSMGYIESVFSIKRGMTIKATYQWQWKVKGYAHAYLHMLEQAKRQRQDDIRRKCIESSVYKQNNKVDLWWNGNSIIYLTDDIFSFLIQYINICVKCQRLQNSSKSVLSTYGECFRIRRHVSIYNWWHLTKFIDESWE